MSKRIFSAITALCLAFALAACGAAPAQETSVQESAPATEAPAQETAAPSPDTELEIDIMVLNGTTGFGMAPLMADAAAGEAALNYAFSVETDASNVSAAMINGDAVIAALPTNAAAALYNRTEGAVQLLALNTLGVLYLVSDGSVEISSVADLAGQTVYVPAQNPTFIFQYICELALFEWGRRVDIMNSELCVPKRKGWSMMWKIGLMSVVVGICRILRAESDL